MNLKETMSIFHNLDFKKHPVTYEDCGVLGGRNLFEPRTSFRMMGESIVGFLAELVTEGQDLIANGRSKHIYPYQRIGVCALLQNGQAVLAYVDEKDLGHGTYSYIEFTIDNPERNDYRLVATCLSSFNIQVYDILMQIESGSFEKVKRKAEPDKEKYGYAYDVFRCLDIRGMCKVLSVNTNKRFHNYKRYNLGEDFYVEAIDNTVIGERQFWLCRDYAEEKHIVFSSGYEEDCLGLFDEGEKHFIIDSNVASQMCKMTIKEEYLFIDNDYHLSKMGLLLDEDQERYCSCHSKS